MRGSGCLVGLRLLLILEPALEHHHHVSRQLRLVTHERMGSDVIPAAARRFDQTKATVQDIMVGLILGVGIGVASALGDVLTFWAHQAPERRLLVIERAHPLCFLDGFHELATDLLTHDAEACGASEAIDCRVGEDRLDRFSHGAEDAVELVFDAGQISRRPGRERVIHHELLSKQPKQGHCWPDASEEHEHEEPHDGSRPMRVLLDRFAPLFGASEENREDRRYHQVAEREVTPERHSSMTGVESRPDW